MQPLTITGPSRLPDGISKNLEKCPYSTNDAAEYLLAKAAISKINRGLDSLPPLQPLHFAPHWGNPINVCSGEKRDATITSVPSSTITNPTFKSSSSRTKLMAVQGHNGQIKPYSYFSSSPSRMLMIRRLYGMSHNVRNIGITELWQRHLYDDGDCCICGFSACDYFKKAHYFTGNFGEPHCSKFTADADDCCAYYSAIRDAENQAPTDKTSNRQAMMKIQMKLLMLRQLPKSYSHYDAAHCEVSHPLQRGPVPHQQHMIPMMGFPTQHFQCWSSPMIEHQIPMNPGFSRLEPSETFRCGSTKPPGGRSFPTTRFFNAQDNGDYERFTWENVSSAQMHEILRHQHHEECSDPGIPASTNFMPPFAENFRYFDPRSADLFDVSFSSIIPEDYRTEHFAFFHPYDSMHDYLQQQEQNENDIAFSAEMKN
ncbi:unnamed protein product [Notodromas monacha]|uniref:Uncharacterized protein n=1 Tax=Notodromas monacha TaxID=399045 RepID=A0A7R9GBV7_9CRUS|nr:unnamed protein product [Notodromas monacha]CAG0915458.1 unnamed protein product [Notodromas monacha]